MNKQKEMTARNTSVGADDRQSLHVTNYSITNQNGNINAFLLNGGGRNGCLDYRLYPNTSHIHPYMYG